AAGVFGKGDLISVGRQDLTHVQVAVVGRCASSGNRLEPADLESEAQGQAVVNRELSRKAALEGCGLRDDEPEEVGSTQTAEGCGVPAEACSCDECPAWIIVEGHALVRPGKELLGEEVDERLVEEQLASSRRSVEAVR